MILPILYEHETDPWIFQDVREFVLSPIPRPVRIAGTAPKGRARLATVTLWILPGRAVA